MTFHLADDDDSWTNVECPHCKCQISTRRFEPPFEEYGVCPKCGKNICVAAYIDYRCV